MSAPISDPLEQEHRQLRREVQRQRAAFERSVDGAFAVGMKAALADYLRMREEGVSVEDGIKGIDAVLRELWPNAPTKFPVCPDCGTTGWMEKSCWHEQRCGREHCQRQHPAHEHTYVVPCVCLDGDRHRPRAQVVEDQIAAAGRVQKRKPRGFSRMGS